MKYFSLVILLIISIGCNAQLRYRVGIQDYSSINALRNDYITPRPADKIFMRPNKALYYYDNNDTTSPDDGLSVIVQQPNRRWKIISHIEVISSDQAVGTTNSTANVGINTSTPIYTLDIIGVDGIRIPAGTTNQRPANANTGLLRYNTTTKKFEGYNGTEWVNLSF
jgi:hypothetical protein